MLWKLSSVLLIFKNYFTIIAYFKIMNKSWNVLKKFMIKVHIPDVLHIKKYNLSAQLIAYVLLLKC